MEDASQQPSPAPIRPSFAPLETLFAAVPPLAVLAAIAALLDLFYARIVRIVVLERIPADQFVGSWAERILPLFANITAIAGVVAMVSGIVDMMRSHSFAPISRRVSLAAFLGVFGAALIALTLVPVDRGGVPRVMVVVTIASGCVLQILILTSTLMHGPLQRFRLACWSAFAACLLTLLAFVLSGAPYVAALPYADVCALWVKRASEVAWLLTPLFAAPRVLADGTSIRTRLSYFFGFLAFMLAAFSMGIGKVAMKSRFAGALYFAERVELFVVTAPLVYSPFFGLAIGAGIAGILGPRAPRQQAGAALILWLSAGSLPVSPVRMLMGVLAVLLLARASISDSVEVESLPESRDRSVNA